METSIRSTAAARTLMKGKAKSYVAFLLLALFGCQEQKYRIVEIANPTYIKNTVFEFSEDLSDPKFEHLKVKYQLDTIFKGEQDEFKRSLIIRNWIHTNI